MAQMHCTQAGDARRPGDKPDVRGFTESRMSGLARPDVWAGGANFVALYLEGAGFPGARPDVRDLARRRMSGVDTRCPRSGALGGWAAVVVVVDESMYLG